MLNICFNKKFYNSLKIAKKQGLIEDSEILLIQKEILVEYVEADKYRNIISKNTDITLWYSRSPKELYCLYFIVNKLINKKMKYMVFGILYIPHIYNLIYKFYFNKKYMN